MITDVCLDLITPTPELLGKQVYIMLNDTALSINDLILVTVTEVISKEACSKGVVVKGTERIINHDLTEEIREHKGHAVYLWTNPNRIITAAGVKIVLADYDDYGPYLKIASQKEIRNKYFVNAVFRFRGVFFYMRISGNYLFKTEEDAFKYMEAVGEPAASITRRGMIVSIFGDNFLVEQYSLSINEKIYKEANFKEIAFDRITKETLKERGTPLEFVRYVLKYF